MSSATPTRTPTLPHDDARDVVEGIVERITFASEDTGFRVVRVRVPPSRDDSAAPLLRRRNEEATLISVVGKMAPVAPGETIRAIGRFEDDARHGRQLRAKIVSSVTPTTSAGLERYLASGVVKGIGKATAKRLVEAFGERTVHVLDHEPERLRSVKGLTKPKADLLAKTWREQRVLRELLVVATSLGVAPSLAMRIHKRYGDSALQVLQRTPYRLAIEIWGVGFRTADAIAAHVGISPDDPQRAQAATLHALQSIADEGHTVTPRALLRERTARLLELPKDGESPTPIDEPPDAALMDRADAAIDALASVGLVTIEPEGLSHAPLALAEQSIADAVARLTLDNDRGAPLAGVEAAIAAFETVRGVTLARAQRAAIATVASARLAVITGGPGVGKTTVVRALVSLFDRAGLTIALAAPTGRAAKRMNEATGRPATTIHRLLEYDPRAQGFTRSLMNPLHQQAIVVDESSMLDASLASALFQSISTGSRLVLVGDVDQLPSVGPGAVLRDLIESGAVPTARLNEVFRQSEGARIVTAAHAILRGEDPEPSPSMSTAIGAPARSAKGELFLVERSEPSEAVQTIVDLVATRIPRAFGLDARTQIQVLVPMVKGIVGTRALNAALQARLNPTGPAVTRGEIFYRVGDRVIQLRNDYEREVFNGDVGHVSALLGGDDAPPTGLRVRFEDGREVEFDAASLDALSLAYACTVHKAQGSEYPAVVLGLVNAHYVMLARKLLYTAVTRGRLLVVIVGSRWAISQAVQDARGEERRTTLGRRLRDRVAGR